MDSSINNQVPIATAYVGDHTDCTTLQQAGYRGNRTMSGGFKSYKNIETPQAVVNAQVACRFATNSAECRARVQETQKRKRSVQSDYDAVRKLFYRSYNAGRRQQEAGRMQRVNRDDRLRRAQCNKVLQQAQVQNGRPNDTVHHAMADLSRRTAHAVGGVSGHVEPVR